MDDDALGSTGCGQGYVCRNNAHGDFPHCHLVTPVGSEHPPILPRYRLCKVPAKALREVYGLPTDPSSVSASNPQIAYYSSMGAIDAGDSASLALHSRVETVVIVVHGSARNADDYLCCMNSALPEKDSFANNTIMIVSPWLLTPLDPEVHLISQVKDAKPLIWSEDGPIAHTWRYGADALNANFSAYAVVDVVLKQLNNDRVRFPRLRRVVVAGHSAGGREYESVSFTFYFLKLTFIFSSYSLEFTQRWALLSNSPVLENHRANGSRLDIRTVVANPRSFCFLDDRRYINGTFQIPPEEDIRNCPDYNAWEWGLGNTTNDSSPPLVAPYKDKAIAQAGGVEAVIQRYATRHVVYLAGELDTEESGNCRAMMQGVSRRERSEHFMASLYEIYGSPQRLSSHHHRLVVHGVHHDHCLMFQSPEGRQALFGLK